jgi:hypothetical protein
MDDAETSSVGNGLRVSGSTKKRQHAGSAISMRIDWSDHKSDLS